MFFFMKSSGKIFKCGHKTGELQPTFFYFISSTVFVGFYFQILGVSPDRPIIAPRSRHNGGDVRVPQRLERRRRRGQPARHTAHPARRHRPVLRRCAFNRVASTSDSGWVGFRNAQKSRYHFLLGSQNPDANSTSASLH